MDYLPCRLHFDTAPEASMKADHGLEEYVLHRASTLLGPYFKFTPANVIDDHERTGFRVYDVLSKILPPRSAPSVFYWRKVGKPFASMLQIASFPIDAQIAFLVFFHARLADMMGPATPHMPESLMTFDGSPIELSWVIPRKGRSCAGGANREIRFAIEPMDPCTGRSLQSKEVLRALTSLKGGMGIVRCEKGALDWSYMTQDFLSARDESGNGGPSGGRFFIGFDFAPSGDILLKTYYYLPFVRQPSNLPALARGRSSIGQWDSDFRSLRHLLSHFDPPMNDSLESLIAFTDDIRDESFKPRLQILSMDCLRARDNRLKLYCRPAVGSAWSDVLRGFTLNGRLASPEIDPALARLETLWNLLFPFADSKMNCDLETFARRRRLGELNGHDRTQGHPEHPTGGLLFYYSLIAGSRMVLPKIYLPVSRYCPNDLFITNALEAFYALDSRRPATHAHRRSGWVSAEVSAAYNHRRLSDKSGIHTYITFALKKDFSWEVTSYFSPEVWEP